jgi:hypothetical protein
LGEGRRVELNEVIREFRRVGEKVIELGEKRRGVFRPDRAGPRSKASHQRYDPQIETS